MAFKFNKVRRDAISVAKNIINPIKYHRDVILVGRDVILVEKRNQPNKVPSGRDVGRKKKSIQ